MIGQAQSCGAYLVSLAGSNELQDDKKGDRPGRHHQSGGREIVAALSGRGMPPVCHAPCKCSAVKALTGGAAAQRSTCTSAVAALGPWLSRDVP